MTNEYIGKTCPYCKTEITSSEDLKVCPSCNMPHHQSCWDENKGCTTFGCSEQYVQQTPQQPAYAFQSQTAAPGFSARPDVDKPKPPIIPIVLAALGIILFIVGIFYKIPARTFSFRNIEEYVGGDAYNASIEAAIRGGEIAGAKAAKAIYICGGLILTAISAAKINFAQFKK
jgi:hypothetical protein